MSLPRIDTGLLLSHSMTALPVLLARWKGTLAMQQSTLKILKYATCTLFDEGDWQ
jgi:hypothetical protein